MIQPWMRVDLKPEPFVTVSPLPCNTDPSQGYPSIVTLIGKDPSWLEMHLKQSTTRVPVGSTVLTPTLMNCGTTTWINRIGSRAKSSEDAFDDNAGCLRENIDDRSLARSLIPCISQLMSDVVIFDAASLDAAVEDFLNWIGHCSKISFRSPDRPSSILVIDRWQATGDLERRFLTACLKSPKAKDMLEEDIQSFFSSRLVLSRDDFQRSHIQDLLDISRRMRKARRHLWSYPNFQKLHLYFVDAYIHGTLSSTNLVREFTEYSRLRHAQVILWPELFATKYSLNDLREFVVPLMGLCLARRALLGDHGT